VQHQRWLRFKVRAESPFPKREQQAFRGGIAFLPALSRNLFRANTLEFMRVRGKEDGLPNSTV
jgi:hypothetical protein